MVWSPPPDPIAVAPRRKLELALDRAIPNWREIQNDPWWVGWLTTTYLYSELSRQRHFDAAAARGDAEGVAQFFRDFLAWRPRRAPPQAGPAPTGKHIYTRPEILQLHAQHRKGAFAGREVEWARIENDIIAAGREGRVVGGIPLDKSIANWSPAAFQRRPCDRPGRRCVSTSLQS
jgi:hypothetical protein